MKPKAKHPTIVSTVWTGLATLVMLTASCRPLIGREVSPTNSMLFISSTPSPSLLPPTPTASVTPSASPSSTPMPSPTRTPFRTATITWTPLPTLSANQSQAFVESLLKTNAGCRLPCWWGIVPGETQWESAHHFLASFATEILQGEIGQVTEDGHTYRTTNFDATYKIADQESTGRTNFGLRDELIVIIHARPPNAELNYHLSQMLTQYGKPSEVLLQTSLNVPASPLPFSALLFYPEQGILAFYDYDVTKKVGEQLWGCIKPIGPSLWLWAPERQLTIGDIQPDGREVRKWRSLEDATGMDIETFYLTFKDPDNNVCIETPVEFWP